MHNQGVILQEYELKSQLGLINSLEKFFLIYFIDLLRLLK